MKKQELLDLMGLELREVNNKDMEQANTTYQRRANYVLTFPSGVEYYCEKGTTREILSFVGLELKG